VLEEHLVAHVLRAPSTRDREDAAGELIDVVRTYLK
jgi:DNA-binding FrmR family transcriptional regulator